MQRRATRLVYNIRHLNYTDRMKDLGLPLLIVRGLENNFRGQSSYIVMQFMIICYIVRFPTVGPRLPMLQYRRSRADDLGAPTSTSDIYFQQKRTRTTHFSMAGEILKRKLSCMHMARYAIKSLCFSRMFSRDSSNIQQELTVTFVPSPGRDQGSNRGLIRAKSDQRYTAVKSRLKTVQDLV